MQSFPTTSFRPYLAATISLLVIGWGTAAVAVFSLTPTVWARWLLFFGGTVGLTGLSLPAAWFLNLRFPSTPPAGHFTAVRQALWVGVYGAVLTWLQQERLVTLWVALGLAAGLAAIEFLISLREKSRWQPRPGTDEPVVVEDDPDSDEPAGVANAPASEE